MPFQLPPDVQRDVTDWIATGHYASEAEVLRAALRALSEEQSDLAAVREAMDDLQAGDPGMPVRESFEELRAKHGISRAS